jgi:PilZ domain
MVALLDRLRTRQAFRWEFTERRALPRIPVCMPVRLRIGRALYEGHAHDVSAGGVSIQVVEQSPTRAAPEPSLARNDRGALELFIDESHLAIRVRIARVQRRRGQTYLGLALDDPDEAVRLAKVLAEHEYCSLVPVPPMSE